MGISGHFGIHILRRKCIGSPCKQYMKWKYRDFLDIENYAWKSGIVQSVYEHCLFFLSDFLGHVSIPHNSHTADLNLFHDWTIARGKWSGIAVSTYIVFIQWKVVYSLACHKSLQLSAVFITFVITDTNTKNVLIYLHHWIYFLLFSKQTCYFIKE